MLYSALWRAPARTRLRRRLLQALVLLAAVVAFCSSGSSRAVAPLMPFNDNTVGAAPTGGGARAARPGDRA